MFYDAITREDIILALDALYSAKTRHLSRASRLSLIVHILSLKEVWSGYKERFSDTSTIIARIERINNEYEHRYDDLHAIAEALRRNGYTARRNSDFPQCNTQSTKKYSEFPEGEFLGILHAHIEHRDGNNLPKNGICSICHTILFNDDSVNIVAQNHLIVPPTKLDLWNEYPANFFVTVCPTCHDKLHNNRPWIENINNCGELLR